MPSKAVRLLWPLLALLASSCATLGDPPLGWTCFAEESIGDVHGTGAIWIEADGRTRSHWHKWEWSFREGDVELLEHQWLNGDRPLVEDGPLIVFVNLPRKIARQVAIARVEGGQSSAFPIRTSNPVAGQSQYPFDVPIAALEDSVRAGRIPAVVGYDKHGAAVFRVPLHVEPIARGREALHRAVARAEEMARSYGTACQRDRRDADSLVMALI